MNRLNTLSLVFTAIILFACLSLFATQNDYYSVVSDSTKLEGEILSVVSEAPKFPGCKDLASRPERNECATNKMLKYIYGNIKYPDSARENGVQGTSVIGFVVAKDGSLHNFKIVRSIGSGCDEEALRVVQSMPKWDPGLQEGEPVNVKFNLPIKFKLEDSPTKEERKNKKKAGKKRN